MKVRLGFVSNSSSSSFTCDVCGATESGMNMSVDEADMVECENGHIVCHTHLLRQVFGIHDLEDEERLDFLKDCGELLCEEDKKQLDSLSGDELDEEDIEELCEVIFDDIYYKYPAIYCPVCQMDHVIDSEMLIYLLKITNHKKENIQKEIKSSFENYGAFKRFLKN